MGAVCLSFPRHAHCSNDPKRVMELVARNIAINFLRVSIFRWGKSRWSGVVRERYLGSICRLRRKKKKIKKIGGYTPKKNDTKQQIETFIISLQE